MMQIITSQTNNHGPTCREEDATATKAAANQVMEALAKLDSIERKEYDHAFDLVPELVVKESRYLDFLRIDGFDAQKAAKRMAMYWKNRKRLFGDRWLLPLTQTGTGALTLEDVEVLRSGIFVGISRPAPHCPVFLLDYSKLNRAPGSVCNVRLVYYFTMLFADEISSTGGVDIITLVTSTRKVFHPLVRDGWNMVLSGLPLRFNRYFVVQNYEEGKERYLEYASFRVARTLQYTTNGRVSHILIKGDSKEGIIQSLQMQGFAREHIPVGFGGSFQYSAFDEFIRVRLSAEDAMSAARLRANIISPSASLKAIVQVKRAPNESQKDFARRRNAVYARRVYQRRQTELTSLQRQHDCLEASNAQLKADNHRLEELLAQAKYIVAAVTASCQGEVEPAIPLLAQYPAPQSMEPSYALWHMASP